MYKITEFVQDLELKPRLVQKNLSVKSSQLRDAYASIADALH